MNWQKTKIGIKSYSTLIYLWLGFIVLCAIQIIPLPSFIVSALSPTSFELFSAVNADQFYLSVDPGQSMISFVKMLSFFCLFVCVLSLVTSEYRIRLLLLTFVASGTFQALYGSLEVLLGNNSSLMFNLPVDGIATGTFVYKNHYANFLVLCLAAGIGLVVTSLQKGKATSSKDVLRNVATTLLGSKTLIRICIAIMVIGLVMSRSRMGLAAFFIALTIVGVIALVLIKNRSRSLSVFIISMIVIDLFIVSTYFGLERIKTRLMETSLAQESRDEVIKDAYPIISDFPLTGSGAGSFYSTFPSYQVAPINAFYDHLHNDFLQFLIEYGVIGMFILSTIVIFCIYKCMRAMRKRKNSIFKGAGFACLMAYTAMSLQMMVDFPLQAYANAAYFVVFLGLSMVINSLKLNKRIVSVKAPKNTPTVKRKRKRRRSLAA